MSGSKWKMSVLAGITLIEMLLFSDTFYGFNSINPVYKKLGAFSDQCLEKSNGTGTALNTTTISCSEQDKLLGMNFIVWLSFQALLAPLFGLFFDKVGIRISRILMAFISAGGYILFGLAQFQSYLLFPAGCLGAFASMGLCMANTAIATRQPAKNRNLLISVQCGLMGTSSIVFLCINWLYEAHIPIYVSFSVLAALALVIIIGTTFTLVDSSKEVISDRQEVASESCVSQKEDDGDQKDKRIAQLLQARHELLQKLYPTKLSVMCSWRFLMNMFFFTLTLYRFVFFVSQLGLQLELLFGASDPNIVKTLKESSSIFFSMGVIFSVATGIFIDFLFRRAYHSILLQHDRLQQAARQQNTNAISPSHSISGIAAPAQPLSDQSMSDTGFPEPPSIDMAQLPPINNEHALIDLVGAKLDRVFMLPCLLACAASLTASILVNIASVWVYYIVFLLFCLVRSLNSALLGSYLSSVFPSEFLGSLIGCTMFTGGAAVISQFPLLQYAGPTTYGRLINFILITCPCLAAIHPLSMVFYK